MSLVQVRALGRGSLGPVWLCASPAPPTASNSASASPASSSHVVQKQVSLTRVSLFDSVLPLRELRLASAVSHANLVEYRAIDATATELRILMEYSPLGSLVSAGTAVDQVEITKSLLLALHATHRYKMLHRNIKPCNILVFPGGVVKLADLGMSRANTVFGSASSSLPQWQFMAPEILALEDDSEDFVEDFYLRFTPEADIWSLGAALYASFSGGALPYKTKSALKTPGSPPPSRGTSISAKAWNLISNMLSRDVEARRTVLGDVVKDALTAGGAEIPRLEVLQEVGLVRVGVGLPPSPRAHSTALHAACSKEQHATAVNLIEAGADINATDEGGNTPLILAARHGYTLLVKRLIENGANLNAVNTAARTAFHLALTEKHLSTALALIVAGVELRREDVEGEGVPDFFSDGYGYANDALEAKGMRVVENKRTKIKEWKWSRPTFGQLGTVLLAVFGDRDTGVPKRYYDDRRSDIDAVALLLIASGADVLCDTDNSTALTMACFDSRTRVALALIHAGAKLDVTDYSGYAALHYAALRNDITVLKALLERGADVDVTREVVDATGCEEDSTGSESFVYNATPVFIAATEGNIEAVKILYDHGASLDLQCGHRPETALSAAFRGGHDAIVTFLCSKIALLPSKDKKDSIFCSNEPDEILVCASRTGSLSIVESIVKAGAFIEWRAVYEACKRGHFVIFECLVGHIKGVDDGYADGYLFETVYEGDSILHAAAEGGSTGIIDRLCESLRQLTTRGVFDKEKAAYIMKLRDMGGKSARSIAIQKGVPSAFLKLLEVEDGDDDYGDDEDDE